MNINRSKHNHTHVKSKIKENKHKDNKTLHDFKTKNSSNQINSKLIELENQHLNRTTIVTLIFFILGFVLVVLGFKEPDLYFECFSFKIKSSNIGTLIMIISIVLYFSRTKTHINIENDK